MWDESLWRAELPHGQAAALHPLLQIPWSWKTSSPVQHFSRGASFLDNSTAATGCLSGQRFPSGDSSAWNIQPGISLCFHSSSKVPLICKPSVQQREQGSCSCDLASGWHFLLPPQHPAGSTAHVIPSATGQIRAGKSRMRLPGNTHCTHLFMAGIFKAPRRSQAP